MTSTAPGLALKNNIYFPALTGVRALAAYLVFIQHVRPEFSFAPDFGRTYLNTGHTGVTMFFVLSGFLITTRYADAFANSSLNFTRYFGKRIARIFPLYIFVTIIILVWQRDFDLWHWFLNLTLLKGFFDVEKDTGLFQAWSLTVEETFYVLAPLLFLLFRKFQVLTVLGLLATGVLMVLAANRLGFDSFMADLEFMVAYTFFGRCFEFYCGYRLAKFLKGQNPETNAGSSLPIYTTLGALAMLVVYVALNLSGKHELMFWWDIRVEVLLNNFILPPAIAVFYYGLLTERTWISWIFATPVVQFLGKASFAFYLIHPHNMYFYEFLYFHFSQNKFLIFLGLNVMAIALFKLVEEPINRFLNNRLNRFDKRLETAEN